MSGTDQNSSRSLNFLGNDSVCYDKFKLIRFIWKSQSFSLSLGTYYNEHQPLLSNTEKLYLQMAYSHKLNRERERFMYQHVRECAGVIADRHGSVREN